MYRYYILAVLAVLALPFLVQPLTAAEYDDGPENDWFYATDLSGNEEVPPVDTDTTGEFDLSDTDDELDYELRVHEGENITAAHLHCAEPGENGPIVVTLFHEDDEDGVDIDGLLARGTIDEGDIEDTAEDCASPINTMDDLYEALDAGDIYVNVHNVQYPRGLIRGQVEATLQERDNDDEEDYNDRDDNYYDDDNEDRDDSYGHDDDYSDDYGHKHSDSMNDDYHYKYEHTYKWYNKHQDNDQDSYDDYGDQYHWYDDHDGKDGEDGDDGYDGEDGEDGKDGHDSYWYKKHYHSDYFEYDNGEEDNYYSSDDHDDDVDERIEKIRDRIEERMDRVYERLNKRLDHIHY